MHPTATKTGFNGWIALVIALVAIGLSLVFFCFRATETPLTKAINLVKAGKAAAALPILEDLSRRAQANSSVFPWLAQGYLITERLAEGRTALDTALKVKAPKAALCPVVLAYADYYLTRGDFEEAQKLFDSAIPPLSPSDLAEGRARLLQAWAAYEIKDSNYPAAISKLEMAHAISPLPGNAKASIASELSRAYRDLAAIEETKNKDSARAIELLKRSLAIANEPLTHMNLANLYFNTGQAEEAIREFTRVRDMDPNNLEARHRLIDLLIAKKDYVRSQEALMELAGKEKSVENFTLLAFVSRKLGNDAGTVRSLEEANSLHPNDIDLLKQLQRALFVWSAKLSKAGKIQESISVHGHAERVSEQITQLTKDQDQAGVKDSEGGQSGTPGLPPITLVASRMWLAKGSLTPEGEIKIKNTLGQPITDLSLSVAFVDNTTKRLLGSVGMSVAAPSGKPFLPDEVRSLYVSSPNIVHPDHQLAVIILWKGKLLREFPVVKQQ